MAAKSSVFANVKYEGVKAKKYDAEGNEEAFEVREDEEQDVKFQELIDLLLAAGYFRARIKGLNQFDKVVGGMTWCLTVSNEDVDVDLLFQENSSIRQKIGLTEKIVAALPRLKCPHRLEPHQIQGLDFIHIYPVVQWLVKKALETREEMTTQIRKRASFEFSKHTQLPEDKEFEETKTPATETVADIRNVYKPRRQFRAPESKSKDEETLVHTTLLEYGRRYGLSRQPKENKDEKKSAVAKTLEGDEEEEDLVAMEEARIKNLMKGMSETEDKVSSSAIGSIVGLQSESIQLLSQEYAQQQAANQAEDGSRVGGAAAHSRAVAGLKKQIQQSSSKTESLQAQRDELENEFKEMQAIHAKIFARSERIADEMAKLDELEGDEDNQVVLAKLRSLVALNETLKRQEQQFRATCKSDMADLQEKIENLKNGGVEDIDDERSQAIQAQFDEDTKKLQKIRLLAARRNREIAALQRKIDEVPSRSELTQYQRRFVELYQQVAAKLRETKQYYTLYNTLDDTKLYMSKEVSLLNSIHDTFEKAMGSNANKQQFLKQFENIVTGIKANKGKVEDRQQREKSTRDVLSDKHLALIEKEREYYKTVKDYEAECSKNEVLLAKLKKRGDA